MLTACPSDLPATVDALCFRHRHYRSYWLIIIIMCLLSDAEEMGSEGTKEGARVREGKGKGDGTTERGSEGGKASEGIPGRL